MFIPALRLVALAAFGLCVATAHAQSFRPSAASNYLNEISSNAIGSNYSIGDMLQSSRNQTRGQTVGNGMVRNFHVASSPASSGVGRTPASARISTLPGAGGGGAKPFANARRGSTVSPYLSLFNTGVGGAASSVDNYNTLVRPQLRQQELNRSLQRQTQQLNTRVQQISAQPAFQAQGSDRIMATGHATVFGYYSRFYPTAGSAARRR